MNLKDRTHSIWEGFALPNFKKITENKKTEVCVVGAGIAGVMMSYQLAKRGFKVLLVDAFTIGSGQSGRTTAHLSHQLEEEFQNLLKMHSLETVKMFHDAHKNAIETFDRIIQMEGIPCDFKRLPGYLFLGKNEKDSYLKKERDAAKELKLDLPYVHRTPLLKEEVPSLKFSDLGRFHPMKFMGGLIRCLKDLGVEIYENSPITDVKSISQDLAIATTGEGFEIEAKNMVLTTDGPIHARFDINFKQHAYRTYSIALKAEASSMGEDCLLWDTEDPYHYIRFQDDELIIGGEDHHTGHMPSFDPFKNLESWARANFSGLGEVTWKWSGQVFEPVDQIAFIGRNSSEEKNIFIATGFAGIGYTSAAIASDIIPDLIEKGFHPLESIFDPARNPLKNVKEFMKENVSVGIQYKDWITPSEVKSEDEIPEDTGRIMREGLSKQCVYHEAGDNFERKSAVCTHLGGIVHWNDIEKTWDCPVHGSRFNTQGTAIEGPANTELGNP